jgi:hypothetical protein
MSSRQYLMALKLNSIPIKDEILDLNPFLAVQSGI